ncbi:hypothetical protein KEM54_001963 [Ascosphaera aggregata]|nr:hypothetical protein KEM54_001963 [Ascosphaera aggregata]
MAEAATVAATAAQPNTTSHKPTKNQLRRAKKKAAKKNESFDQNEDKKDDKSSAAPSGPLEPDHPKDQEDAELQRKMAESKIKAQPAQQTEPTEPTEEEISKSLLSTPFGIDPSDPLYDMFSNVMNKFETTEEAEGGSGSTKQSNKPEIFFDDDDIPDEEDEETAQPTVSKRKRKEMNKVSVAGLKAMVKKPELVEWTDASASDPRLLVQIKSYRNVVPVPNHWSLKREYLSSKRGVEKAPFSLPKFIQETGITEMRDAALEKQEQQSLKQKQRERVQPKMGRLDIDYQKLYEAFFRFQTKPQLTRFGEVYYEGKEYETNLRHLRPGELSDELKAALNIPPGAPPPWLINQQRFGPPPSYPALKIPGLNAPPPPGGMWGFHPGGYGKPPVDEHNRPLYGGDIFGVLQTQQNIPQGEPVEKDLWGELQPYEESEEEESDEEDEVDEEGEEREIGEEDIGAGLQTPSGLASVAPTELPAEESIAGEFDVRKQRRSGTETEEQISHHRSAYTVVPEQQTSIRGFFGGERVYDLKSAQEAQAEQEKRNLRVLGEEEDLSRKRKKPGDVDVALDPETMDKQKLKEVYEANKAASSQEMHNPDWSFQEDLSDMIASESRKRLKKEEERRGRG